MDWLKEVFSGPGAQMGLVAFTLALAFAAPPVARAIKEWKGKRNGNGDHEDMTQSRSGPVVVAPELMTRRDVDELEEAITRTRHTAADGAQKALSAAEGAALRVGQVERRQDNHSRILMEVQKEMAEHRGETRANLAAVKEKTDETCERLERVETQQTESGVWLKAIAAKLEVKI